MFGLPKEAAGAIFAALIAGLISLLGLIISKEQKISEFRQAWIDGLRENVALVITHLEAIRGAMHAAQPSKASWQDRKEHFVAINQAITCVRLRLNRDEVSSQQLLLSLGELENIAQAGDITTSQLVGPAVDKLTEHCNIVMKEEWQRVRDGEKTYRFARYGSFAAVAIALALLGGIVARSIVRPDTNQTPPAADKGTTQTTTGPAEIRVFAIPCVEAAPAPPVSPQGRGVANHPESGHRILPSGSGVVPFTPPCIRIMSDGATIQVFNRVPNAPR
jgi:hypothetical protein